MGPCVVDRGADELELMVAPNRRRRVKAVHHAAAYDPDARVGRSILHETLSSAP
jgi:hypothetical protein